MWYNPVLSFAGEKKLRVLLIGCWEYATIHEYEHADSYNDK